MYERLPTSPLAGAGLILSYAVVVASGSRTLGGIVLAAFGVACIWVWAHRDGRSTTLKLAAAGVLAFALSHVVGLVLGAWPAVVIAALATAWLCWRWSDALWIGQHPQVRPEP
jgi:hypothetical protein